MTEQEIEQVRADLAQLDIEQLRCGVMLQLLKIEELTKERDALALDVDQWEVDYNELRIERDALAAAAKLALDALDEATTYTSSPSWSPTMTDECKIAIDTLRQAGVK